MAKTEVIVSIFDQIDILEDRAVDEQCPAIARGLEGAKNEVNLIDDELEDIRENLDNKKDKFIDDELTFSDVQFFFTDELPHLIERIAKLRERLY